MLGHSVRCIRVWHRGSAIAINNANIGTIINDLGIQTRGYSKDKSCCTDIKQTKGRDVVSWSSPDCNPDAKPPTSDPYRIRVPDIVVPPLPSSSAKELPNEDGKELFTNPEIRSRVRDGAVGDLFHNSSIVHPDYWKEKTVSRRVPPMVAGVLPRLGYHGRTKYKFAFHEPWKPLDRLTLLEQAEKEESEQTEERSAIDKASKTPHGL